MEKILLSVVVVFALFQGTLSYYCLRKSSLWYGTDTYLSCTYGCCGTSYTRYCCSYNYNSGYSYSYNYTWSVGAIAGAVIGGIIGFCVLIAIIIAVVKACSKTGTHGRVVQPVNPNNGVFVANSSTQAYPSTTQYGMAPPSYTTPGTSYPPPVGQQPYPPPGGQQPYPPPVDQQPFGPGKIA